ncbi:hypothetical protein LDENG_00146520 [Lucifuga dentata]|nr:hypothetical protein LDENG_00146520 [Lucifuga dentata]
MRCLGALAVALHACVLVLPAQEAHNDTDGVDTPPLQPPSTLKPTTGHHLPSYMVDLYRHFRTDALEEAAARQADTVQSVMAKSLTFRPKRWTATFDLNTLLTDKQIQEAELRIRLPETLTVSNVTVEVYHQHGQACHVQKSCQKQQLMASSVAMTSSQTWSVFNMTNPLLHWLKEKDAARARHRQVSRRGKMEMKVRVSLPVHPVQVVNPGQEQDMSDQLLLVVFSHTGPDENSKTKASLLHTAEQSKFLSPTEAKMIRWPKSRRNKRGHREQATISPQMSTKGSEKSFCRRVDLQVDFNQIGWGSWIIFPKRYNAYRCEGSCLGPLGENLHPTNHAYMQSLLKHYHPDKVDSPCCTPIKMSPLSMLYYDKGEMRLQHHEDMIVDECGCQ